MAMNVDVDNAARFRAAQSLWQRGDVAAAEPLLREILGASALHADAAVLLARLLQTQGRLSAASEVMASLFRSSPADSGLALRCAQFMRESRRHRLAAQLCDEAFAAGCGGADLHALAGNIRRELGDFEAGRRHLLAALDGGVNLDNWFVLATLAGVQKYESADHPDFARLIAHFHDPHASARARAATGFGLAKAYDDIGRLADAAAVLRAANAFAREGEPWSRQTWQDWVDSRLRQHGPGQRLEHDAAFRPIFVVGLPRTGTTLVAQQLSRQAGVVDRG